MTSERVMQTFLDAAEAWVCDRYALTIRYIATIESGANWIWDASVTLAPLPAPRDVTFRIDAGQFTIGQIQRSVVPKKALIKILNHASIGEIERGNGPLILPKDQPLDYYSEVSHRDQWFYNLHLHVAGSKRHMPSTLNLSKADNALRKAATPFDGLADVASWLGLRHPGNNSQPPSIAIRILPPVDLIYDQCAISDNRLSLTVHAHPKFDVKRLSLGVRSVPDRGTLSTRRQVADEIKWGRVRESRREGRLDVATENADGAIVMLMIEDLTVRRQWFSDRDKARNDRLLAVQQFDKDLKMVKNAVLESQDSLKFENGVSMLLFLMGFSSAVHLETDAPDLVAVTPKGKIVLFECTLRIGDFGTKLGKLVDRRGSLSKSLEKSDFPSDVVSILVCRLPRDQIAAHSEELRALNTILITREDLERAFNQLYVPRDPDQLLDDGLTRLTSSAPNQGL